MPNNDSTIYYDYLVEGLKQPLVRLNLDPTNTFVTNIQYLQGDTNNVSIQYIADEIEATIFPNPTSDIINIQSNDIPADGYNLRIVDMTGRIILQQNHISEEFYPLSLRNIPNGHYILVLHNQKGQAIKREAIEVFR